MSDTSSKAGIPATIDTIATDVEKLGGDPAIITLERGLLSRIPTKVRAGIYETGRVLGLVGAGAFAVAGTLEGNAALYATATAGLLLAVSAAISKANLSS